MSNKIVYALLAASLGAFWGIINWFVLWMAGVV